MPLARALRPARLLMVLSAILGALLLSAASAGAAIKITSFGGSATAADGSRLTQAGAHPDVTTKLEFETRQDGFYRVPTESAKTVQVDLPPGLVGAPAAFTTCPAGQMTAGVSLATNCPADAQVGTLEAFGSLGSMGQVPLYNLPPAPGQSAVLAANILGAVVRIVAGLRADGGYRIAADVTNSSQGINLTGVTVRLWGVPGDPVHDQARLGSTSAPRVPFMSAPTACTGAPLTAKARVDSWENPGVFDTASFDHDFNGDPLVVTGCDKLSFAPSASAQPDTRRAAAPTGLGVNLGVAQSTNPDGLASSHLKKVEMQLPEGMVVNASSADGLGACTSAQIGLGDENDPTCPDTSKIGRVTLHSPLIEQTLTGSVYLAKQGDNPFNSLLALYVVAKAPGLQVKLPGLIQADPKTGRLTATFDDNPQLPFDELTLALKTGPRAPLSVPTQCGTATTTMTLTPWSGTAPVEIRDAFQVSGDGNGSACGPRGFAPGFEAGTTKPAAGADSPFVLRFSRTDGDQSLSGLTVKTPAGLLGRIRDVPPCAEAQAGAGTCDAGSQIGSVTTLVGAGSSPFSLPGRAYITGPYKGQPYGLSMVVPAVAGPLDLGTVVVRASIAVDPQTAALTIVSDPLPTILRGIPLQIRQVEVNVNRSGFMFNPTSCAPMSVDASLTPAADGSPVSLAGELGFPQQLGSPVAASSRFQVGDCASLGYTPKLAMTMSGKGQTKDGSHPALAARLTPPPGDANSKKVTVTLPLSLALDPGNANGLCEPVDAARNACPAASIVGSAQAQSILPDTLKAPVYFVRGERVDSQGKVRKTLPKLFIPLTANGVTVNVTGSSDVQGDRLVTTFDNLPDAPFSTFDLTIDGGAHGILAVSNTNVCAATQIADAQYAGQNGKAYTSKVTMGTPCTLGVVKTSHTSTALKVTIGGLGAGKVSASGNGVTKASKTLASATTATLSLKLSKATRRALARGRDVKVKVKVAFTAKGQKKAKTATKTVVLHGAKKR